ncbi:DUF3536 domain-containing protein [Leptolyngbya sp. FACHB-261]|uniref:DUF3536 domain-containing protein n=1 Tax=Leptolyngbya sp. FACHB-261 TaxID=2692806 RepID=UPI0016872780|nr:DUF3536 domain-containing protein [Leptolyngbya sp. FACHB-261]MBD2101713.1 DUF3536 domain-containing protein [Leptolyngbya sp. FACHB-261]
MNDSSLTAQSVVEMVETVNGNDPRTETAVGCGVYMTVHGHFYQPPRENPYLDAIERQEGAAPFHNWNERIHHECYRPNAFARILNERGEVLEVVNNYEYLSFNIGPTLLSWLERYDIETYQRILEADRKSAQRLVGPDGKEHGNAIGQVYNHIIMPLANAQDKLTQIRWGKADFQARFGREPEGMWLAEAAVDYPTLEALVAEGIRFIVLAPSQALRCRDPQGQWHEVSGSQIDATRPYRCYLKDRSGYLDIFFYDGPISRDMGFNDVLRSSQNLAARLGQAVRGDHRKSQLVAVATDGETFGHHKGGTEKALAYAFRHEIPQRGWQLTNFAHYLSLHTPTWEVELKPITAWSCAHGVDRWQDNCGCGGEGSLWHQKWRRPLRDALDWLRDQLAEVFSRKGAEFFVNPWAARDAYIQVVLDRSESNVNAFLAAHQTRPLTAAERVDALRLLEMQRHALLMYTSCGWFFEELSRPEGTQILRYAARALELAGDVAGVRLEPEFVERLKTAPSNVEHFGSGEQVYHHLVKPFQVSLEQVAAHYAISSLFNSYPRDHQLYCYQVHQGDYQLASMGSLTLAVGQIQLVSEITGESADLMFAVLHLGGWDFHCCIQPFQGRRRYEEGRVRLFETLQQASAAKLILRMSQEFGDQSFDLQHLFPEERHRLMRLLTTDTLTRLDQLYAQVYRDNYGVLLAFRRDGVPVPEELRVAAEIALNHRLLAALRILENYDPQTADEAILVLEAVAAEARQMGCALDRSAAAKILDPLILRHLWDLTQSDDCTRQADITALENLLALGHTLELPLNLGRVQELYLQCLRTQIGPACYRVHEDALRVKSQHSSHRQAVDTITGQLRRLLQLGENLRVDVSHHFALLGR